MTSALLRTLVRYGYAPFMLLGLNIAAYIVITQGHSYFWLAILLALAFATSHAAEHILPWYDEWNDSHGDETTNILHTIVYEIQNIDSILLLPLIAWLSPWEPIWPSQWPLWAQFIIAIVLADFGLTFLHYLSHRYPLLWRLHAVHHGVSRLYGFNGLVRHPLHQIVDIVLATGPLAVAGMPTEVAALLGFAISVQLIVQHSNVAYDLGPFRDHLSIGRIHHLHHVNWGKEGDCNFGLFLTLWDRMLGTFQPEAPRPIKANDMGIDEVPDFPKSYAEQFLFPLHYTPGDGQPQPVTAAARARAIHDSRKAR